MVKVELLLMLRLLVQVVHPHHDARGRRSVLMTMIQRRGRGGGKMKRIRHRSEADTSITVGTTAIAVAERGQHDSCHHSPVFLVVVIAVHMVAMTTVMMRIIASRDGPKTDADADAGERTAAAAAGATSRSVGEGIVINPGAPQEHD